MQTTNLSCSPSEAARATQIPSGRDPIFPFIALLSVSAGLLSLALTLLYSRQHILDQHAFRQTQTALTSYWFCREGFKLGYETPVLGYPWSIPFELPLYQAIVSLLSCPFRLNLEQTGRLVSYVFLLACLIPATSLLRLLYPASWRPTMLAFAALFLLAPIYLYWGRSFMIETAALFLTLSAARASWPIIRTNDPSWKETALTAVLFSLAFLQKSTTVLPVWALLLSCCVYLAWRQGHEWRLLPIRKLLIAFGMPLLVGVLWTRYSDAVKSLGKGREYITSAGLMAWNFGGRHLRLSPDLWIRVVWSRMLVTNIGGILGIALLALAWCFCPGKTRIALALLTASFLLPILIFTNLHYVHDYYQSANLIYVIAAVAVAWGALYDRYPDRRLLLACSLAVILCFDVIGFMRSGYFYEERIQFTKENNRALAVGEFVRDHTEPAAPMLVFGTDWSSELPFYSERKALAIPAWFTAEQTRDVIQQPRHYLNRQPGAAVFCGKGSVEFEQLAQQALRIRQVTRIADCDVVLLQTDAPHGSLALDSIR